MNVMHSSVKPFPSFQMMTVRALDNLRQELLIQLYSPIHVCNQINVLYVKKGTDSRYCLCLRLMISVPKALMQRVLNGL
jgi:hypothetical protein